MPDRSIRVALIAGGMYEGLYGRIPELSGRIACESKLRSRALTRS